MTAASLKDLITFMNVFNLFIDIVIVDYKTTTVLYSVAIGFALALCAHAYFTPIESRITITSSGIELKEVDNVAVSDLKTETVVSMHSNLVLGTNKSNKSGQHQPKFVYDHQPSKPSSIQAFPTSTLSPDARRIIKHYLGDEYLARADSHCSSHSGHPNLRYLADIMQCRALSELSSTVHYTGEGNIVDVGAKFIQRRRQYTNLFSKTFNAYYPELNPKAEDYAAKKLLRDEELAAWDHAVRAARRSDNPDKNQVFLDTFYRGNVNRTCKISRREIPDVRVFFLRPPLDVRDRTYFES